MKSTHNKAEQQVPKDIKYPCLMIGDKTGVIVLFSEASKGVIVLQDKSQNILGYYDDSWNMSYFTPLPPTESITLSND